MNLPDWPVTHREALARFYAAGHNWTWQQMCDNNGNAVHARRWIESSPAPPDHPLLLPRLRGDRSIWYAIAFNDRRFEALREELNAFLGSAGTDFSGTRAELDLDDPPEAVLAGWSGPRRVFRISVIDKERKSVRTALSQLLTVYRLKPARPSTAYRTTEALLREFFAALVNHDENDAARLLSQLQDSGRLSAENLNFLKVERHAAFGRWTDIVQMPEISLLARITRPRNITALIAEALWRVELASLRQNPKSAVDLFQTQLRDRFPVLFRTRQGIANPSALLMFALAAAVAQPAGRDEIETICGLLKTGQEFEFVQGLLALIPKPALVVVAPPDLLMRAKDALAEDRYDEAWALARRSDASAERCKILIGCAAEIASQDAAAIAMSALDSLPVAERDELLKSNRRAREVERLRALVAPQDRPLPHDWESWFNRLDDDSAIPGLLEVAHRSPEAWPDSSYRTDPMRVGNLAQRLLDGRPAEATRILTLALPHFLSFFLPEGAGVPMYLPVYKSTLLLLACGDAFSESDWMTAQTLLEVLLASGVNPEAYRDALDSLRQIWLAHGSAFHIDWALDTIDLLAIHKAQDANARDEFFSVVLAAFRSWYRRIERHQWAMLQVLSTDLGKSEEFDGLNAPAFDQETEDDATATVDLQDRTIGIYTLTEASGRHAAAVLQRLFPGVDVRLNHDKVATAQLESLARESDYLVVATGSAKHAATIALKANRPQRATPPIYPGGKGSSSIISALLNRLAEAA